jgi:wyosine [tRNA(Phe)-imidazoG37] synthetase (radical SAM superfamily)
MTYLFGPVPSRRLGRSLGIDLVAPKSCTFDCIYCEVGPTSHLTVTRREYQTEAMVRELEDYFTQGHAAPDFLTLTGSGEPTLNLGLGRIISFIKQASPIPVAVLTNGSLLFDSEVRRQLAAADVVLPSLDAAREETFQAINRPHPRLSLKQVLSGLEAFRRDYRGQIWLEILLLKGLNDSEADLTALRKAMRRIAPDKVQLNTTVRPVVEDYALPLSPEDMAAAGAFLGEGVEIIASFDRAAVKPEAVSDAVVLKMLSRRPMTAPDLARALALPLGQVQRRLAHLQQDGLIFCDQYQDQGFYRSQPHEAGKVRPQP